MTFSQSENFPEETERLTDVSDQASAREAEELMIARQEHARAMRRQQEPNADGTWPTEECDICGEEIGEARLKVAIKNRWCIHCATLQERNHRR